MGAPGGQVNDDGGPSSPTSDPASRWIELFYDLIFVAALLIFSVAVGHVHPSSGIIWLVLVFAALWWVWFTTTLCANRFHMVDLRHRLLLLFQMLVIVLMAMEARVSVVGDSAYLAAEYGFLLLTVGFMYFRAARRSGSSDRGYAMRLAILNAVTAACFFVAAPIPEIRAAHPFRGEPRPAGDRLDRDVAACGRFLGHRRGALARAHGRVHPHRLRRSVRGDRHFGKRRHHRHSQYRGARIRVHPGVRAVYQLLRRHPGRWPESAAIRPVGIAAPGYPDRYRRDGSRRVQAHQSQDLASPS